MEKKIERLERVFQEFDNCSDAGMEKEELARRIRKKLPRSERANFDRNREMYLFSAEVSRLMTTMYAESKGALWTVTHIPSIIKYAIEQENKARFIYTFGEIIAIFIRRLQ
jgi:hypothetical protein